MNTIEPKAQNASKCLALLQIPILLMKTTFVRGGAYIS